MDTPGAGRYQMHPLMVIATKLIKNGFGPPEKVWWIPYGEARHYSLTLDDLNPDARFTVLDEPRVEKLRAFGHEV